MDKYQGVIIVPVKEWEHVVINVTGGNIRPKPGMELVEFSRATSKE